VNTNDENTNSNVNDSFASRDHLEMNDSTTPKYYFEGEAVMKISGGIGNALGILRGQSDRSLTEMA